MECFRLVCLEDFSNIAQKIHICISKIFKQIPPIIRDSEDYNSKMVSIDSKCRIPLLGFSITVFRTVTLQMYSHRINDWLLFDMAINVCYLFKNYTHCNHFWKWNYHSDTSAIRIILSAWRSSLACFKLRGQQQGVNR